MRLFSIAALVFLPLSVYADTSFVDLGTAGSYAVLGGSTVTNTGPSDLFGNLGVSPGTAITGFPPGVFIGTLDAGNAAAMQAQSDLSTAYNAAKGAACGMSLTGDLGGLTLAPGSYCFSSSAQLTGTLTLNAEGNPNAVFLFQIGSTLTTASASSVVLINGYSSDEIIWQVGSSATLGTTTAFAGNILALTSITLNTGANIQCGSALAENGAVTLDTNDISICAGGVEAPEPSTASLLLIGIPGLLWLRRSRSRKRSAIG